MKLTRRKRRPITGLYVVRAGGPNGTEPRENTSGGAGSNPAQRTTVSLAWEDLSNLVLRFPSGNR